VSGGNRAAKARRMEEAIHGSIAACNTGDADAIAAFFAPGAVHYSPGYGSPAHGGHAIGALFARLVQASASRWSIDQILCDAGRDWAIAEWAERLRTRYCSRSTGSGSGFSGAAESRERCGRC